eukprot:Phypoly_transcript_06249.p1 GENE.Phypoly_transcript_06249~~Phypoly_transcript_06249.p1  ORF type:complete len:592 (+),score=75.20 Phypoly_transcript_06249:16-1791(+)
MDKLDQKVQKKIFKHLSVYEVVTATRVCSLWRKILIDKGDRIWRSIAKRNFGGPQNSNDHSWYSSVVCWENELRHAKKKKIWAIQRGHMALLSKIWKPKDSHDKFVSLQKCFHFGFHEADTAVLVWCAKNKYFENWDNVILSLAARGVSGDRIKQLLQVVSVDWNKTFGRLLGSSDGFRITFSKKIELLVLLLEYLNADYRFQSAILSNSTAVLELVKQNHIKQEGETSWLEIMEKRIQDITPLMYAVLNSVQNSVEWLLNNGADVHVKGPDGRQAIHFVSQAETLDILLHAGASLNEVSSCYWTPIHYYVHNFIFDWDFIRHMLEHGADINFCAHENGEPLGESPVFAAGHLGSALGLLKLNANPFEKKQDGDNIIHYCIKKFSLLAHEDEIVAVFDTLLKKGWDPKQKDNEGQNLLLNIRGDISFKVAKWLVEVGKIDLAERDYQGNTVLMKCFFVRRPEKTQRVRENLTKTMSFLIEKGIDVHAVNNKGQNVLYYACTTKDSKHEIVEKLLDLGVQQLTSKRGNPLHRGAHKGTIDLQTVKLLVERGADLNAADESGVRFIRKIPPTDDKCRDYLGKVYWKLDLGIIE